LQQPDAGARIGQIVFHQFEVRVVVNAELFRKSSAFTTTRTSNWWNTI
jgi:hypothetical protein